MLRLGELPQNVLWGSHLVKDSILVTTVMSILTTMGVTPCMVSNILHVGDALGDLQQQKQHKQI